MGYTTKFKGKLSFGRTLNGDELAYIKSMFWAELDEGDWILPEEKPHYIQFELAPDFSGIQWDGSEKFYKAVEAVNFIIINAKTKIPDFSLAGRLEAQGEDFDDRWYLEIGDDGMAHEVKIQPKGKKITCPHCGEDFRIEEE